MKDPAFLFYYQDFLVGTDELTNEEVGAYIRCLCHQAHKGYISEKHMKIICNSSDIHNAIKNKFISTNDDGFFYNERLKSEIDKRKKYAESRSNNRKGKKKETINISKSYDKHMENENEDKNVISISLKDSKKTFFCEESKELNEWSKNYFHEKYINDKTNDTFDKLIRIDGYKPDEIKQAIQWARNDDFWSTNFLSPIKLRTKDKTGVKYIDVFLTKILHNATNKPNNKGQQRDFDELANILYKHTH